MINMWRKRKKKNNIRLLLFPALVLFVTAGIFLLYNKSDFLSIKKIDIQAKNVSCADADSIRISTGILGQNFFLIKQHEIENNLKKKFACIKSIGVSKTFPDKISLRAVNREVLAVLASLKNKEASLSATPSAELVREYFLVDSEGVVFGSGVSDSGALKIYIFDREIAVGKKLTGITADIPKILDKFKSLNIPVDAARINQEFFIVTSLSPASQILFRLNDNVNEQLASLQLILNKAKMDLNELEFIDLRFDKPVVRFAPKK